MKYDYIYYVTDFMTNYNFIFSNKPRHRFSRHLAFWIIFSLHFVIQNLMIGGPGEAQKWRGFAESFYNTLFFFPIFIAATYFFIEIILPHYLYKRKYFIFFLSSSMLIAAIFICSYYSGIF